MLVSKMVVPVTVVTHMVAMDTVMRETASCDAPLATDTRTVVGTPSMPSTELKKVKKLSIKDIAKMAH